MSKQKIVLDIWIPTFNRNERLRLNLQKIANIVANYHDKANIRILVSNNCSTDQTSEFLSQIIETFEFIKIFNQARNLGFLGNVKFLWDISEAKYVWTISDDDFYSDELVECVIKVVSSNLNHDPIVINSFHYIDDFPNTNITLLQKDMMGINSNFKILRFRNGLAGLLNFKNFTAFGLMSASIFPGYSIKKFLELEKDTETSYPHQLLLFKYCGENQLILLNNNGLGWRAANSNWNLYNIDQSFQAHFSDYLDILKNIKFANYFIRRKIYNKIFINSFKATILYLIKNKKGVNWLLKNILINNFYYMSFSLRHELLLIILTLFKFKKLNILLLRIIFQNNNTYLEYNIEDIEHYI